jgi:enoyl-CoA hydratase
MSMTGQVIDAATAERIGLVTEVVPHDRLMARVMDCARAIAEVPPDTVRGLKEMYVAQAGVAPVLAGEREIARRHVPDWAGLEKRRLDVMARNRAQIGGGQA